uniref:fructose-bisphosphate aldolase n=1 Tax=Chlamydomonas sp. HS-5 TaxID=108458 RepID=Q9XFU6_9CHLO|nr:fructose-bisphosphate aldolase precursor [Chlamydomonas sp. HS-5]
MDESNATCGKRLDSIGVENTEENRRAYRDLLLSTPGLGQYISGAILFEETLYQSTKDGKTFVQVMNDQGIVPGIKVDKGLVPLVNSNGESWCMGLDGLDKRCAEYYKAGARFAKWRSVISIPAGPSIIAQRDCPTAWPATPPLPSPLAWCPSSSPRCCWTVTRTLTRLWRLPRTSGLRLSSTWPTTRSCSRVSC